MIRRINKNRGGYVSPGIKSFRGLDGRVKVLFRHLFIISLVAGGDDETISGTAWRGLCKGCRS